MINQLIQEVTTVCTDIGFHLCTKRLLNGRSLVVNLRERTSCMPLKTREDITGSPKQGFQWLYKRTRVRPKFYKRLIKMIGVSCGN